MDFDVFLKLAKENQKKNDSSVKRMKKEEQIERSILVKRNQESLVQSNAPKSFEAKKPVPKPVKTVEKQQVVQGKPKPKSAELIPKKPKPTTSFQDFLNLAKRNVQKNSSPPAKKPPAIHAEVPPGSIQKNLSKDVSRDVKRSKTLPGESVPKKVTSTQSVTVNKRPAHQTIKTSTNAPPRTGIAAQNSARVSASAVNRGPLPPPPRKSNLPAKSNTVSHKDSPIRQKPAVSKKPVPSATSCSKIPPASQPMRRSHPSTAAQMPPPGRGIAAQFGGAAVKRTGIAAQIGCAPCVPVYSDGEDDEYEDDFIDDSDLASNDYQKCVAEIHKTLRFDASKYAKISRFDDLSNMEASYREIQREEVRSARIAAKEDAEELALEMDRKQRKLQRSKHV